MTREEAIIHMTLRREELKHSVGDLDEDIKAFDMAIKALEQEPTDTWSIKDIADTFKKHGLIKEQDHCTDAISREETLTAFANYVGSGMSMDDYDALWNIVAKMPPVTQEPILDKIRDEIVHLHDWAFSREEILRIIDKYKTEGSEK